MSEENTTVTPEVVEVGAPEEVAVTETPVETTEVAVEEAAQA